MPKFWLLYSVLDRDGESVTCFEKSFQNINSVRRFLDTEHPASFSFYRGNGSIITTEEAKKLLGI